MSTLSHKTDAHDYAPVAAGSDSAESVLLRWTQEMTAHLHAIRVLKYHLPASAQAVEKATRDLSEQFQSLASGAGVQSQQMRQILEIADSLEMGEERISLKDFTQLFSNTLTDSIEKILFVSKRAITMVYMLDEAMENLSSIEHFLDDIQQINKKANLLALNATIEAVQAGSSGKGFKVVASEVKDVSTHVRNLAMHMRSEIEKVTVSVKAGYEVLKDVATTDMSQNLVAQDKLSVLLQSLIKQNETFSDILRDGASTSELISKSIGNMVMHMQFQDRNSQCIENSLIALTLMEESIESLLEASRSFLPAGAVIEDSELYTIIPKRFRLSAFSQSFHDSVAGMPLEAHPTAFDMSQPLPDSEQDGDSIELF